MRFFKVKKWVVLILLPIPLWAASVLPLGLKKISQEASIIFVGRCIGSSHELDENGFPSYWLHYQVEEGIQEVRSGDRLWVKQFDFHRAPVCSEYEEVILFLYPESRAGFTSPIGFGQGRFFVEVSENGEKQVRSPYPHLAEELGDLDLDSFVLKIRRWIAP